MTVSTDYPPKPISRRPTSADFLFFPMTDQK